MCFELRSSNKLQSPRLYEQARTTLGSIACGRWRFRTADLFGVNEARYHCANRPSEEGVYRTLNDIANLAPVAAATGGQSALATWFTHTEPLICVCRRGCTSVLNAPNGADREIQARKAQCGRGSVGRASPCQGEGREFESRRPLGDIVSPNSMRRGKTSIAVEWPRGEATDCKSVYTGSNPVSTSGGWRSGSALP